MTKANQ